MNPYNNPYKVVRQFEKALSQYTGGEYTVAVTSCTMALQLVCDYLKVKKVSIPKFTYCSVPMCVIHAGGEVEFDNRKWKGAYQLKPYPIWDSARYFTSNMYKPGLFMCVSFHWTKILGLGQGGAIIHDDPKADKYFRRARFDGRKEGVAPKDDKDMILGRHCYMSPRDAAEGLSRLAILPKHNKPLPNDPYPDLSKLKIWHS